MANIERDDRRWTLRGGETFNAVGQRHLAAFGSEINAGEWVEVVATEQLREAVEALREWLDADDAAETDFNDTTGARLDAAIARARSIVGGQ